MRALERRIHRNIPQLVGLLVLSITIVAQQYPTNLQVSDYDSAGLRGLQEWAKKQKAQFLAYDHADHEVLHVASDRLTVLYRGRTEHSSSSGHGYPAWSPDSARVAFVRLSSSTRESSAFKNWLEGKEAVARDELFRQFIDIRRETITVVDVSDKARMDLAIEWPGEIYRLSWAPDGDRLAFVSSAPSVGPHARDSALSGLFVLNLRTASVEEVSLEGRPSIWHTPVWSRDGASLLVEVEGTEGSSVTVVDLNLNASRRIVAGRDPSWSPDGKWIAYVDPEGDAVYLSRLDGSERKRIASVWLWWSGARFCGPLLWSPDARYLGYHQESGLKGYERDFFIRDLSKNKTRRVYSTLNVEVLDWKPAP